MKPVRAMALSAARSILHGPLEPAAAAAALTTLRGRRTLSLTKLAAQLVAAFGEGRRPRLHAVAAFLEDSSVFQRAFRSGRARGQETPPAMQPCAGPPQQWAVPAITTPRELAAWLTVSMEELDTLTSRRRTDGPGPAHHYHFQWIARRRSLPRLIEAPKARLKSVQHRILTGILNQIPPHPAAHGFRAGHNIVSFTAPHAGQRCVLRMDVQDFFPSIRRGRVVRVFLSAGYPESVASLLADLCTTATPSAVTGALTDFPPDKTWPLRRKLRERHLPQGAPTSPALANLAAFRMDARLSGLARRFEARYTRYADDLLFSGGGSFARDAERCEILAGAILLESGLAAAHRKTKRMPQSVSQRAAGLVLNCRPALPRRERDQLRAILTNCVRHGPSSQNHSALPDFRAHLLGRLSHAAATHPASAARLRGIFDRIDWRQ